jgi:hypothetical protein
MAFRAFWHWMFRANVLQLQFRLFCSMLPWAEKCYLALVTPHPAHVEWGVWGIISVGHDGENGRVAAHDDIHVRLASDEVLLDTQAISLAKSDSRHNRRK